MSIKVFVLVAGLGDGSSTVEYFDGRVVTEEQLDKLCFNDNPEDYACNEMGYADVLQFPDDFDFKACGISLRTSIGYDDEDEDDAV